MAANVKSVTALPDGNVIITYTDLSTKKESALNATDEIKIAKLAGSYVQGAQTAPTAAFGTNTTNGGATNVTGNPVVDATNLTAYYQQALSSKADGYAKIRKAMLDAGIISKGTKGLSSVATAWGTVLQGAQAGGQDPFSYLSDIKKQGAGIDTGTTGSSTPQDYTQVSVWDPTKAKDLIYNITKSELHREPTQAELADYTTKLQAAQKSGASTTSYKKDKSGKLVATTSGGLDEQQFVTDLVRGNADYAKVQGSLKDAAVQQVNSFANANGLKLSPSQLTDFASRIKNGEDAGTIAGTIRSLAGIGQPENVKKLLDAGTDLASIYQPYKNMMAQTLEINPNTITLDDPTLRGAIMPDKEMSLYDYQKSLRKDPRWQYTNQARSETSDAITTVLKDFGFMG